MSEHEDILCDADAAFTRLQVPPFVVEQFFYMISNDDGEVALQPLALFLDFQVSLGRMLVDERDEAVEHGRRVVLLPVDAVRVYWSNYRLPVRRTVVPNILAGIDTKGSDEISSLSGNGNGSGIAGLQAGDSKTNATNAGVAVQVANAKETKEEKSTDIEDVELSMEENSNTVLTSSVGSPMEESSGRLVRVSRAAVANAVVVDVAEEGSSMDKGTPNSVQMEDASSGSVGGANTSRTDNVVDAVAEEGSSMDEGTPNSVEMEDTSSVSVAHYQC
ncbi:predicted protein [Phaeodactylum tricornutum CCAP 1055/1]|jgi:hypothetical protein|uniref:Uncharacterized protein n=1 Tax=Phaeodactylum tricornutum (strain CCAP 1055/1) TaxID=556484 RepID=B7S4H0_PHATC|nr:predicted protein [Phaeodactylum tricornutum CCAP 1055/1]EEC42559.1 predicted protein [Phaeodactylum tricornutum CCAP 1055/1]|eukprot:XP_002176462.1 predicted protein [Phaeodactylum tricornutum CCAP 1055/1]